MNDIINKANIFDKSLILNKEYNKFEQFINNCNNSELINDANFINNIKKGLIEKNNRKQFEINNIKSYGGNKLFNNDSNINISNLQLSNTFTNINNTLKNLTENNYLKENKNKNDRNKKEKEKENENIKMEIIRTNETINDLNKHNLNLNDKIISLPLIEKNNSNKDFKYGFNKNKQLNSLTPNSKETSKTSQINNLSLSTSFPESNKHLFNKNLKNISLIKNISNNDLVENENYKEKEFSSLSSKNLLSSLTNANPRNYIIKKYIKSKIRHNERKNNTINLIKSNLKINNIESNNFSLDETNFNLKKNFNKLSNKKTAIEEYNNFKNIFLLHLYKRIKLKTFNENKKEISDYLRRYKGIEIKKPNLEKGSELYNLINTFINKSVKYNLPNKINKIRNKTNIFDYKKTLQLEEFKKLDNKIKNLIYNCAEDILNLNNDIKI